MAQLIDRRLNGRNKSAVNRQRFIRRFKAQIKRAVSDAISGRSITDASGGEEIRIPTRDIREPRFRHGPGGRREGVHPGNRDFVTGDRIARPSGGQGSGGGSGEASNEGIGEDDFVFELSRDEFLECFFEDLELPNLKETEVKQLMEEHSVRAGFTRDGVPANINIVRSVRGALARRIAVRGAYKARLEELEEELEDLRARGLGGGARAKELVEEIDRVKGHIRAIPFLDTFDLRFHNRVPQQKPSTQAVMFCLMDVSGSMDAERKDIAKRFFILLYLFLNRSYEHIDVVFIRHHVKAKEVDEDEFFHARETGGTVVSTALELMDKIIKERYPASEWNIYGAQASDGENWGDDSSLCRELLDRSLLPAVRYYAYVEIRANKRQSLWESYEEVAKTHEHLAMRELRSAADIFPVFRTLLEPKAA